MLQPMPLLLLFPRNTAAAATYAAIAVQAVHALVHLNGSTRGFILQVQNHEAPENDPMKHRLFRLACNQILAPELLQTR